MEADEHEHDSTFGGDRASIASSSTSILSAVTKYQYEHGRRYHGYEAGKYLYPNDEKELNRQDLEHTNQLLQMEGKLFLCPLVEDPKQILELGTGTGIWCIDMADTYPNCEVIGTDLSPVQPAWVPPNCKFEIDDWDKEWTFGSNRFDMIHLRFAIGSVKDYPLLYKRVLDALRPGGSFQLVELEFGAYSDDGTLTDDSALVMWGRLMHEAFAKMGVTIPMAEDYEKWLSDAGFENVQTRIMRRPMNDWPKDPRMKEIGRV
ncbi:hypothetical protein PRZ48_013816 [Zasmidium cellare]|uniref:S-adenosyl-L-methionine-dependent methyltransferase n=1 Tax=Zasmidium cellare TaxID=395010 RepID=A0ABR0E236_ZASCE|nr:hypothetical protein PRZ48_013816 [Zasmidium cellare]